MPKSFELVSLYPMDGLHHARIYNIRDGYYITLKFWDYSKKEIIHLLRNEYDCVVHKSAL